MPSQIGAVYTVRGCPTSNWWKQWTRSWAGCLQRPNSVKGFSFVRFSFAYINVFINCLGFLCCYLILVIFDCTLCPQNNKVAEFYLGPMKFYKIWRTYSWVYSGHNCSCISYKACAIPLPEAFYFNDVLHNWKQRLLVEWRKLDLSIVDTAIRLGWLRGTVVECRSLTGELSLSCTWPAADGWPPMRVNRPLWVSQLGWLSLSSFWDR